MKVLILSTADKRHMPMIAPYIRYLKHKGIAYDIIRSNRYIESKQNIRKNVRKDGIDYEINMIMPLNIQKWKKIVYFLRFYICSKRIISNNKYDYIIVWNENTAALFASLLTRRYAGRYCINIRDPINDLGIFKNLAIRTVNMSHFSTVPSPDSADLNMPYGKKIVVVYNKDYELLSRWTAESHKREQLPIRLTHLGFYSKVVRGANELADLFGNDKRFSLFFYGAGFDKEFQQYIEEKGYRNIFTKGAFDSEKTKDYLENTDIINSYYNMFEQSGLKTSFGIKHSYTTLLYIPSLADEDTTWGRLSKPYNLSFLVNRENIEMLPDLLFEWYNKLDFDEFKKNCDKFNLMIDESIAKLYKLLDDALKNFD